MNGQRHLDYPLHVGSGGRFGTTGADDHVRDLLHQVLFTRPGERVNRPDFGCGLLDLVFEPNSDLLVASTELLVRGSLERWLGDVLAVESLRLLAEDSSLTVELSYVRLDSGERADEALVVPRSTL